MALPNTIEIKFEAKGDKVLVQTIKSLDKATKSLIKAQSTLAGEGKKQVQSHNKNKSAITRVNTELALQGSNWKKAGISAKLYTSAVKGNSLALAKVRIATKKHIADLTRQKKGLLDTAHSTRILGGSLAVLRSKLLIASFAFSMILMTVGKMVKAYARQEKAERKLAQALKSTGHAAGITHKELLLMASGLQAVTTHGDEAIVEAQALMLTFTNIHKDVFPQALESILNVSDAMGQDLQQSTIQIGKALNDPIQGMSALRRIGIQLSKTQQDQVKTFVNLNDMASAQKVILGELETQFGGMARSMRLTLSGSLAALGNSWGDMMEALGEHLAPLISGLADALEEVTWIMKSEGEKQLYFLETIGASEETIRLARIRLLKEEAQERLNALDGVDIDLKKTETLNTAYQQQQILLVAMRDNLKEKETALANSSDALLKATGSSKDFNQALAAGEEAAKGWRNQVAISNFGLGGTLSLLDAGNLALGKKIALGKKDVDAQKEKIAKQIEFNVAFADYLQMLGLLPELAEGATASQIDWQERALTGAQLVSSQFSALTSTMSSDLKRREANELETLRNTQIYMDADADRKKQLEEQVTQKFADEKLKIWKMERLSNVSSIIMNTASGMMKAMSQLGMFGTPIATLIAAMGAAQLGIVHQQQPPKFAEGGLVKGQGSGDTVPAVLTPGEFVIKRSAVQKIGLENLFKINNIDSMAQSESRQMAERSLTKVANLATDLGGMTRKYPWNDWQTSGTVINGQGKGRYRSGGLVTMNNSLPMEDMREMAGVGTGNTYNINISAPLVDETVVDSIIPAIEKAQRLNLA